MFSDGVSDNLFDDDYLPCLESLLQDDGTLLSYGAAANCIARKAYINGKKRDYLSPFSVHAKEHNKRYLGGKHDDITITVAQIFSNRTKIDTYTDRTFPNLVTVYTSSP